VRDRGKLAGAGDVGLAIKWPRAWSVEGVELVINCRAGGERMLALGRARGEVDGARSVHRVTCASAPMLGAPMLGPLIRPFDPDAQEEGSYSGVSWIGKFSALQLCIWTERLLRAPRPGL